MWCKRWEVDQLRAQGYRVVPPDSPDYLPQYDQTLSDQVLEDEMSLTEVPTEDYLHGEEV